MIEFQSLKGKDSPCVFIAIPNMNTIYTELVFRLLQLFKEDRNLYLFAPINQIPHDRARNICHKQFITRTDCEYIWWIDSDTIPPYNGLDKLLSYDKDIVSLTVPSIHQGNLGVLFEPNALRWYEEENAFMTYIGEGLEPVDVTTIACTLIKRKVMEDVGPGAFDFKEKEQGDGWNIARWGEDLYFGLKYREAGYQAWHDYSTVCEHYSKPIGTSAISRLLKNVKEGGGKQ